MKKKLSKKVFICATEQSGDNIGSEILSGLHKKYNKLEVNGVGGYKMKKYMKKQFFSLKDFKSMGIVEIIFSVPKYIKMINFLSYKANKDIYDLIITIDSPDFNYPLAKKIKKLGCKKKIIQIVAPTVWAWREKRAIKFSKVFDEIFTLFSFENKYFEKNNLKSTFIGNPIYYIKKPKIKYKNKNIIAFLPGSRLGEIEKLFPYFQNAYEELNNQKYKFEIFIPTLPHLKKFIFLQTKNWKIKTLITTDKKLIEKTFAKVNSAIVCSGTASLEIAKREIPQIVIYKLNFFTEIFIRLFVKVKFANIINILANKTIIPEFINSNLNKDIFLKNFKILISSDKFKKNQINLVKKYLKQIIKSKPPYEIAIKSLIKKL